MKGKPKLSESLDSVGKTNTNFPIYSKFSSQLLNTLTYSENLRSISYSGLLTHQQPLNFSSELRDKKIVRSYVTVSKLCESRPNRISLNKIEFSEGARVERLHRKAKPIVRKVKVRTCLKKRGDIKFMSRGTKLELLKSYD